MYTYLGALRCSNAAHPSILSCVKRSLRCEWKFWFVLPPFTHHSGMSAFPILFLCCWYSLIDISECSLSHQLSLFIPLFFPFHLLFFFFLSHTRVLYTFLYILQAALPVFYPWSLLYLSTYIYQDFLETSWIQTPRRTIELFIYTSSGLPMRMSPCYYLWHVALRPDHQWKLISYPYYAKYAKEGDYTFFRHIDINVPDWIAKDRGQNAIQGTLTLTEKTSGQCTVILPGMHQANKLKAWWDTVKAMEKETNEFIHKIDSAMWTKKHAKVFQTDCTDVMCMSGDVRITRLSLPRGSHEPAKQARRTILPWYVGIQDHHEGLGTPEFGLSLNTFESTLNMNQGISPLRPALSILGSSTVCQRDPNRTVTQSLSWNLSFALFNMRTRLRRRIEALSR